MPTAGSRCLCGLPNSKQTIICLTARAAGTTEYCPRPARHPPTHLGVGFQRQAPHAVGIPARRQQLPAGVQRCEAAGVRQQGVLSLVSSPGVQQRDIAVGRGHDESTAAGGAAKPHHPPPASVHLQCAAQRGGSGGSVRGAQRIGQALPASQPAASIERCGAL